MRPSRVRTRDEVRQIQRGYHVVFQAVLTLFILTGVPFSDFPVGLQAEQKGASPMQEKFALTNKPQDAVFITSYGWTGGMGEAILDPATGGIKFFKGRPIFVDSEVIRRLLEGKLPDSWVGELRVGITANIKLVLKTRRNPSIRGAPKETFWEVQINKLHDIRVLKE
jgi:hypothetical protein